MSPRLPIPAPRIPWLPTELLGALRVLPAIAQHTETMVGHTAALREIADRLREVSKDTDALPELEGNMARVAEATAVLEPMDARMSSIEGAMPVLVEVQQHLSRVPDTLERLDKRIDALTVLLDRFLGSLDELSTGVESLHEAVGPLSRIARRLPGQRVG